MVIIELFVYVFIVSMMVVSVYFMKKRELFKKLDFLYFCVLLSLIISQIIIITALIFISPQSLDSISFITPICIGTILVLALIYFITRITESSTDIQEYALISTTWAMFIAFGASYCAILIWFPKTKIDLYRLPIALALCIGMQYYPPVLDQLAKLKDVPEKDMEGQNEAVINVTAENDVEEHEKTIIKLTTEAWYLAKTFEHAILQLKIDQPRRYTSRIEWFLKKAEESLNDVGLRIVNVEGHAYDAGMAADPVDPPKNIGVNDSLEVTWMIEPIIMKGTNLIKRGKVYLRRTES